jgi:tetratricopeptide (TPR) repeat protein
MSDLDPVPELEPEAKAFLEKHAATGEPSADQLARTKALMLKPSAVRTTPPPKRQRPSWLPNEVLAAAAVLVLLLGVQGARWALHEETAVTQGPDVHAVKATVGTARESFEEKAVRDAYRAGELDGATRLAKEHCKAEGCKPLATTLAQAVAMWNRFESLSPVERVQLAELDGDLAGGGESVLRKRLIAPVSVAASPEAERLFAEAATARKEKRFEAAVSALERCIRVAPAYHPCYRLLGSTYAGIAMRDDSVADRDRARAYYERFLELAPPDDEYVPKVRAILEVASDKTPSPTGGEKVATSQFADGDLANALATLEACAPEKTSCRLLFDQMKRFQTRISDLGSLDVEALAEVREEERGLAGGQPGVIASLVKRELSKRLKAEMKAATARDDWLSAVEYARRLLEDEPANEAAVQTLRSAREASGDVYMRGYQLKDSSPGEALALFKQVMAMTSPDDSNHQKAKVRASELEGLASTKTEPVTVTLPLHTTKNLTFDGDIQRVAIGDADIADVATTKAPRTLKVTGRAQGKTTLLVWLVNGGRETRVLEVQ